MKEARKLGGCACRMIAKIGVFLENNRGECACRMIARSGLPGD